MGTQYFGRVYSDVMRNPDIPLAAKGLYAYFSVLCGAGTECFPGVSTITNDLKISEDTFRRYLKILQAAGVVSVRQEKDAAGRFAHNVYVLSQPSTKSSGSENFRVGEHGISGAENAGFPLSENLGDKDNQSPQRFNKKSARKSFSYQGRDNDCETIQNLLICKQSREFREASQQE